MRERLEPCRGVGGVRIEDGADELASLEYLLDDIGRSGETPAVTSLCPLRYLVALCITTSTPSDSGC